MTPTNPKVVIRVETGNPELARRQREWLARAVAVAKEQQQKAKKPA